MSRGVEGCRVGRVGVGCRGVESVSRFGVEVSRPGLRGPSPGGHEHVSATCLSLHQRPQCTAQIRVRLITLDRLALASLVAPDGAIRVSRRRHRVSSHNGLRAPLFEPPKLAAPRCRSVPVQVQQVCARPSSAARWPRLRPRAACPTAWRPPSTHLPARGRSGATRAPSDQTALLLSYNSNRYRIRKDLTSTRKRKPQH